MIASVSQRQKPQLCISHSFQLAHSSERNTVQRTEPQLEISLSPIFFSDPHYDPKLLKGASSQGLIILMVVKSRLYECAHTHQICLPTYLS